MINTPKRLLCLYFALCSAVLSTSAHAGPAAQVESNLPNIILINADDLGVGDISGLNPEGKIPTPHINRMIDNGLTFLNGHSSSGVYTPSRYTLLTGHYSLRASYRGQVATSNSTPRIEDGRATLASLIKKVPGGYLRAGPKAESFEMVDALPRMGDEAFALTKDCAPEAKQGTPFFAYLALSSPHGPIVTSPEWGGIRVPFVLQWPGGAPKGRESNQLVSQSDFLATFAELTGQQLADNEGEDSISFLSLMKGISETSPRTRAINDRISAKLAMTEGDWKLIVAEGSGGWTPGAAQASNLNRLDYLNKA